MKKLLMRFAGALVLLGSAEAALVDRGGGMIYDTTLNITWLSDANYALTSGYAAAGVAPGSAYNQDAIWNDGRMGWNAARRWADNLVYSGYDDWRLPTIEPADVTCTNGGNPAGGLYIFDCTGGELSHLFVVDFGTEANSSVLDPTGDTAQQVASLALFSNIQPAGYWSSTIQAGFGDVWHYYAGNGYQWFQSPASPLLTIAVRSGDVASSVPEPATLALAIVALLGTAAVRERRAAKSVARAVAAH